MTPDDEGRGPPFQGELAAMTRLHEIATRFVHDGDLPALLDGSIDAAIAIVGGDMGCVRVLDQPAGALRLAAHRGFDRSLLDGLARAASEVGAGGPLVEQAGRVVIEDVAAGDAPAGGGERAAMLAAGVRALQSIPLRGRSGNVVGLLSTHHRRACRPGEAELRLLDLVARQCADAIERARSAEARAEVEARAEIDARARLAEKVRETEELFRTTVENMPVNLVLCDPAGRLLYLNPALAVLVSAMCGRSPQEIIGMAGAQVWPEPIWIPLRTGIERAVATGERQTYELATVLPNGQPMVRQWAVVPMTSPDGQVRRLLAMSHDITAQRRLLDELREADRRKSEFIAVLSHELRNPLAAIRTSLYVLGQQAPRDKATGQMRLIIDRQVGHLVRMVDDLLDVTRIAQGKINLRRLRLDVNELVRKTVEDNRAHLEEGGVRVKVRLGRKPVYVDADGARIAQVVTNLLSNAVKFTSAGGTATVSVAADGEGSAVLSVADTGDGIPPALLPRLFEPFMQADHTLDRPGGGLGLGLALVKGLVELHGGEVSANGGGAGRGAELVVRLPLAAKAAPENASEAAAARVPAPRRVLLVEDDRDVAEGLRIALGLGGHRVEVARDGREAVDKARAFEPDVVLCDIGLPGMNGYDVARAFRADAGLRSALLVALSGYAQGEDLEKARAAGFDHHLAKPATMERINDVLAASAVKPRARAERRPRGPRGKGGPRGGRGRAPGRGRRR